MPSHLAPCSPTKRPAPTPSTAVKTLQQDAFQKAPSPPRTPQSSKSRSGRPKPTSQRPTIRPVLRETFLEDKTPVEPPRSQEVEYNSEDKDFDDLSFSSRHVPRLSMFDNMLLSLDRLSDGRPDLNDPVASISKATAFHSDIDIRSRYNTRAASRRRGHTMSSSVSSENEVRKENIRPLADRSTSRIGRSNSNANFSKGPNKLPSIFGEDEPSTRTRVFLAQRAVHPAERSRQKQKRSGRTSSQSSTSSSIDLEQMIAGPPPSKAGVGNRRSRSFDYGSNRHMVPSFKDTNQIEAAPTPIIHAGPAARQLPLPASSQPTALVRKTSNKSSKSHYGRKDRSATLGAASGKAKADHSADPRTNVEALPPLPTHISSPGLSSPFIEAKPTSTLKERPGFFRRMFGSGKNATSSGPIREPSDASQHDPPASLDGQRPDILDRDSSANPVSRLPKQVQKDAAGSTVSNTKTTPPTVTKKSSAFFRRRKKSAPENIPVPLPVNLQELKANIGQPSPVSSLRQVMDPYLVEARKSISSVQSTEITDAAQGYHTALSSPAGPQDAFSTSEGGIGAPSEDPDRRARLGALPNLQIPGSKYSSNLQVPSDHTLVSFLADSSSAELSAELSTKSSNPSPQSTVDRPKTSPTNAHHERSPRSRPDILSSRNSSWKNEEINAPSPVVSTATSVLSGPLFSPATKSGQVLPVQSAPDERLVASPRVPSPLQAVQGSPQASGSELSVYRSAPSTPVIVRGDSSNAEKPHSPLSHAFNDSSREDTDSPGEEERERALMIFENRDDEIEPGTAAAWLGDSGPDRARVRIAYMEVFDWTNLDILASMRGLCDRIALKGETQQVDRILDSFSRRWCECNANHGFKSTDVVHTICYSILLLNTDLHVAEIGQKMTKNQFVRNALPTIKSIASDTDPADSDTLRPLSPSKRHPMFHSEESVRMSEDQHASPAPGQLRPVERQNSVEPGDFDLGRNETGPLVTGPFVGSERGWDSQIENVLKSFYTSISKQRLPLFGAVGETSAPPQVSNNFLTITGNMLRRTPSTTSKTHVETMRGRTPDYRPTTSRWTSKVRSRPWLYPAAMGSSSRTSLDEQSSGWSPGMSSTWSKASLNKTLTSMSVDSFGSTVPRGDYQKSIGFASALSQAYIRDEQLDVDSFDENMRTDTLLEDESLGLCGAPWAKEGILKHKCHLDSIEKKSKDRNWTDCFAVIEKGWMRLFSFSVNAKSLRHKTKEQQKTGVVVGGGNWQDNAEEIWKFLLRQTIASALPPPGYAKSRPYVWALSLPNGAVHLFQVGTPDIVKEFVSTANYWSARLSKEPMMGGVSNMEYGWSDSAINRALVGSESQYNGPGSNSRPSTQSSIRTSIDRGAVKPKLPGDKIHINDWSPPQQNTVASQLMEVDQLKALQTYVKNVEEELQKHNELRTAMLLAFSQRHPNSHKAMTNWERKSSYLLREIVKFQTYIDSLQAAHVQKEKVYAMRKEDENLAKDCQLQTTGPLRVYDETGFD